MTKSEWASPVSAAVDLSVRCFAAAASKKAIKSTTALTSSRDRPLWGTAGRGGWEGGVCRGVWGAGGEGEGGVEVCEELRMASIERVWQRVRNSH